MADDLFNMGEDSEMMLRQYVDITSLSFWELHLIITALEGYGRSDDPTNVYTILADKLKLLRQEMNER